MENSIRKYVDSLFFDMPDTEAVRNKKEQISSDLIKTYHSLLEQGYEPSSAFQTTLDSIGDVSEMKRELANGGGTDLHREALPKFIRDSADTTYVCSSPVKNKCGCGKFVGIGCLSVVVILFILFALIVFFLVREVRINRDEFLNHLHDDSFIGEIIDEFTDDFDSQGSGNSVTIDNSWFKNHSDYDTPVSTDGKYSVPAAGIRNIKIDWVAGDVRLITSDETDIIFTESDFESVPLTYGVQNDTLYIYFCKKFSDFKLKVSSKNLTIQVPKELAEALGQLEIETVSADCSIGSFNANSVSFDSVSGNLFMNAICRNLDFESVSGNFHFASDASPYKLEAETVSGNIYLDLQTESDFALEFETASGDLNSELNLVKQDKEHYVHGAGIAEFEINTVSGDLIINERKISIE